MSTVFVSMSTPGGLLYAGPKRSYLATSGIQRKLPSSVESLMAASAAKESYANPSIRL
jgi:hypothetical protein